MENYRLKIKADANKFVLVMFQSRQQTERKDGRDIYLLLFNTQRLGKELKLCDKDREFVSLCMSFISCTISQTPPGLK